MPESSCANCKFGVYIEGSKPRDAFVVCRRMPPLPMRYQIDPGRTGDSCQGYWPEVGADDVCGEHQFAE